MITDFITRGITIHFREEIDSVLLLPAIKTTLLFYLPKCTIRDHHVVVSDLDGVDTKQELEPLNQFISLFSYCNFGQLQANPAISFYLICVNSVVFAAECRYAPL